MVRPNVRLIGSDVIHMQRERNARINRLAAEARTEEAHSLEMLGGLVLLGLMLTVVILTAVWF